MTREEFMDMVYSELHSDGDNCRANRIIDAADEYAETEQQPKTGHWIYPYETTTLVSICSECGTHGRGNFCPNCGAKMVEI